MLDNQNQQSYTLYYAYAREGTSISHVSIEVGVIHVAYLGQLLINFGTVYAFVFTKTIKAIVLVSEPSVDSAK